MRTLPSLALVAIAAVPAALSQTIVYVDEGLTTGAGDGSSWSDAFQGSLGLRDALDSLTGPARVYIAAGTYVPSTVGDRDASFVLGNGVELYGGFAGGEVQLDERPAHGTASTILSGDLAGDDVGELNRGENSFQIVRVEASAIRAVLDRVTVTGGNGGAPSGRGGGLHAHSPYSITIRSCRFAANRAGADGGAIYFSGFDLRVEDTLFEQNEATGRGGAVYIAGATQIDRCVLRGNRSYRGGAIASTFEGHSTISNSIFHGNEATSIGVAQGGGGAISCYDTRRTLITCCTVFGNRAPESSGGGIRCEREKPEVVNCILWGNDSEFGPLSVLSQCDPSDVPEYSILPSGGAMGVGNIDLDPEFTDAAAGDFSLLATSPAIDAGDSFRVPETLLLDYSGTRRRVDTPGVADTGIGPGPSVDMGALEHSTLIGRVFCSAVVTTAGTIGQLDASGSDLAVQNDVTFQASGLPPNTFGFLLVAPLRNEGIIPASSLGRLCLGGPIGRFIGPGQVMNSGLAGTFSITPDLTRIPRPMGNAAVQAGDAWAFQVWFRESVLGIPTSNFTDGVRIRFQ